MRALGILGILALTGCAQLGLAPSDGRPGVSDVPDVVEPVALPGRAEAPPPPPPDARTAEQFDTTTQEERAAAAAPAETTGSASLGTTVASLGDPARAGFWLETPLVQVEQSGRVVYNGQSSVVTLIPIEGENTAGSRLSLAAMRVLDAPLTGLPEIEVFAN